MDNDKGIVDYLRDSADEFWTTFGSYLPKLVSAIVLLILALIVAKLAKSIVIKLLNLVGFNKLTKNKKVAKTLKTAEVNVDFTDIAGRIVFWIVIIIFALTIADVLELTAMTDVISALLAYLPNVLGAAIVLTVTIAGARLVRDAVAAALSRMRVDYSKTIAVIAQYAIVIFGTVMAFDQLGFETQIIAANITVIVSGFALAFALAFGLGGRDLAGRILENTYNNAKKPKK